MNISVKCVMNEKVCVERKHSHALRPVNEYAVMVHPKKRSKGYYLGGARSIYGDLIAYCKDSKKLNLRVKTIWYEGRWV